MGGIFCKKKRLHSWGKGYMQKVQDQEADPDMQHTAKNRKCRKGQRWKLHGIRKRNIRRATGEVQTVYCVHILPVERIVQRIEAETVSNDRPPEITSRC
nr:MAG TPA: hypothetical protein [Caudoviricetes sp.]